MALIHHNGLRVNSEVPDDTVPIWREQGWASGLHKETDPDDDSAVPRVSPPAGAPDVEPLNEDATKAELVAQAKDLGIAGRSTMTKDELAAAIAAAATGSDKE